MSLQTWLLYVAAVFILTVTPGPSVLMCIASGIANGARRTLFCALGSVTAVVGIMAASALGLGAILAVSENLFATIKWAGVAYLLYLGVTTLMAKNVDFAISDTQVNAERVPAHRLFLNGFLVGASNPKALLFFTAFFPQFLDATKPQWPQFVVLCATFVCFELFWLMFYATFASRVAPWLRKAGRARTFNLVVGSSFVGAAALLATVKRN
jgi:threonine/homoserine/homoserine lactone efflux protein